MQTPLFLNVCTAAITHRCRLQLLQPSHMDSQGNISAVSLDLGVVSSAILVLSTSECADGHCDHAVPTMQANLVTPTYTHRDNILESDNGCW